MGRAYSVDLRERVVAAVDGGGSCREAAEAFGVSVATVVRWAQRFRATGTVAPKPMGGHRPLALVNERDWLLARLHAHEAPGGSLHKAPGGTPHEGEAPGTPHEAPGTLHEARGTLHPAPGTRHGTWHPAPGTRHQD